MASHNYIKLHNQGNIIANLRLLQEMDLAADGYKGRNDYVDENGYFSKRSIAKIGAESLIITSGGNLGKGLEKLWNSTDIVETDNGLLQNVKCRMLILRSLGLVSTDYNSEDYAITDIGKMMLCQIFGPTKNTGLLRELFMCISAATEIYDYTCEFDFECYLGYQICYAFAKLDHKISTKEMPMLTTYTIHNIQDFVRSIKYHRETKESIPEKHIHMPKTQNGDVLKQPSNLTRSINQILRICNIINPKTTNGYYTCTPEGAIFVDSIKNKIESHKLEFIPSYIFRRKNIIEQKKICKEGLDNIYIRSGINNDLNETKIVFSPYQMVPETCVQWLLGITPRKPPETRENTINIINSEINIQRLRLQAAYRQIDCRDKSICNDPIFSSILSCKKSSMDMTECIKLMVEQYKPCDKNIFYPFIHSLLKIIGLDCKGEVGRFDAYAEYKGHIIPVEIKSYTESHCYNLKGLRQCVENKIMSYNPSLTNDLEYSSLVIGFEHPVNDSESLSFIDNSKGKLGINIIACDVASLIKICFKIIWDGLNIDLDSILTKHGIINE